MPAAALSDRDSPPQRSQSVSRRKFDLEEEHRSLMRNLDIDNFSLSRIPRPEEVVERTRQRRGQGGKDP